MDKQELELLVENKMPSHIRKALIRLETNGCEAYVVGGCVRDSLLSIEPEDWDICTSALPDQIIEYFSDYRVILTGMKHGTVTVVVPEADETVADMSGISATGAVMPEASATGADRLGASETVADMSGASATGADMPEASATVADMSGSTAYAPNSAVDSTRSKGIEVEVTTFRIDGEYSDNRHPDKVRFMDDVEKDLARRDFTINAMAYSLKKGIVDFFGGVADLNDHIIRCVGEPDQRFNEDGLRIMRALRFSAVYGFEIEQNTKISIHKNRELLKNISVERLASELNKIILSTGVRQTLESFSDVLMVIIPEIKPMIGFPQNNIHHIYDVWKHTLICVEKSQRSKDIRLAMLFHDIGKPECCSRLKGGAEPDNCVVTKHCIVPESPVRNENENHFYGHSIKGAAIAEKILKRFKYDNTTIKTVCLLILHHTDKLVCDKAHIMKALNRFGAEFLDKLLWVFTADAYGKNPALQAGKLTAINDLRRIMEKTIMEKQCYSLERLAIRGSDVIEAGIPEGRRVGEVLNFLLTMVIEDRVKNNKTDLLAAIPHKYVKDRTE